MTRITWGDLEKRNYEVGCDRGVFYPIGEAGVPWNGLINVSEIVDTTQSTPFYYDGVKYRDDVTPKTFRASVEAFNAPNEFYSAIGHKEIRPGIVVTRQPPSRFNLSYRTMMKQDDYFIHLVYNAIAIQKKRTYGTLKDSDDPSSFGWDINALPVGVSGVRPTAHIKIPSTINPIRLKNLEDLLYGDDLLESQFPTPAQLVQILHTDPI